MHLICVDRLWKGTDMFWTDNLRCYVPMERQPVEARDVYWGWEARGEPYPLTPGVT